jgi:hypothetical protein
MDLSEPITPDADIERAFDWFTSFLPVGEWNHRKAAVESYIEELFAPKAKTGDLTDYHRLIGPSDKMSWYLYLVQMSQHEPYRTEVNQAARVLPIFKRLGSELNNLLKLGGVENQAKRALNSNKEAPDSVLFELLIGLLWYRNGYPDVSFIPTTPKEKRPDIRAVRNGEEWFIEAKRLSTNSAYSVKERSLWLRMWDRFKGCLIAGPYPFILDITFHVELETLPEDFLLTELKGKLPLVACPCELVSNDTWAVVVRFVDFQKISDHLETQYVKAHSRQLQELVGGSWDRKKGFTFVMNSANVRINGYRGLNHYVESIDWAAGAYWHCDAERATEIKARDIRGHLSDAVSQFPGGGRGVVHIGIETPDGEDVEAERFTRMIDSLGKFDPAGKDLRWVYCHLFESYAPPTPGKNWYIDETIYKFGANRDANSEPLETFACVIPEDEADEVGEGHSVHWLRDAP